MAEAEDLLVDAARHATLYSQRLWRRLRPPPPRPRGLELTDVAPRLDLLLTAVFSQRFQLRTAQPPPRPSLLRRLAGKEAPPYNRAAVPATDGRRIWLPRQAPMTDHRAGLDWYRSLALLQGWRARRARHSLATRLSPLQRDLLLVLDSLASEAELAQQLPGLASALVHLRHQALATRPPLEQFRGPRRELERWLRQQMSHATIDAALPARPLQAEAKRLAARLDPEGRHRGDHYLVKDFWTGCWPPPAAEAAQAGPPPSPTDHPDTPVRSARLERRPDLRPPRPDEDEPSSPGPWMVQPDSPHEHAEDPLGLQRPVDRDQQAGAEEFGELVSELRQARLVTTPGQAREVLLSDDPPETTASLRPPPRDHRPGQGLHYPEWDWRLGGYRPRAVTLWLQPAQPGSAAWVEQTLHRHRRLLHRIRRQFDALRAEPVRLRRQPDGDDIDLEAWQDHLADRRAGRCTSDGLYQLRRPGRRQLAISLLIDISGSTDSWVGGHQRIIDVEREALLLVGLALRELGEPNAIQAFSGQGPDGVVVRSIKEFDEPWSTAVALRIAGLEPEHYTRTGAALRHACHGLMQQPAEHRLLLLLSDGKPNALDHYPGRHGVEDMRRAVLEARQQGVFPFCLTVDRQAPSYLPRAFGPGHYALLQQPERLPAVLLDWLRRLLQ